MSLLAQGCPGTPSSVSELDAVGSADSGNSETQDLGTPILVDAQSPPECQCVVDTDCVDHFLGLGPCQRASCNVALCICEAQEVLEGEFCDDDDKCSIDTICSGGGCVGGTELSCSDDNPCTDDLCVREEGCTYEQNEKGCDDSNACTGADTCREGECEGTTDPSFCEDDNECTLNGCDQVSGCSFFIHEGGCDDGNLCTEEDECADGNCQGGTDFVCEDGNVCTESECDPVSGCFFENKVAECDDGDSCTLTDLCAEGLCIGLEPNTCSDGDFCTSDSCEEEGCTHENISCDDDNLCTTETCTSEEGCVYGSVNCDDGDVCTTNTCVVEQGCQATPGSGLCDDGEPCTVMDTCENGACISGPLTDCDDGNPCTLNTCDAEDGCSVQKISGIACIDSNACTADEECVEGACGGGVFLSCDDGNSCTDDSCAPQTGCLFIPNTHECDDGLLCTVSTECAEGECTGGLLRKCDDGNECTLDSCLTGLGCVVEALSDVPCDDGVSCSSADTCQQGICVGEACPCTEDSECESADLCAPVGSCVGGQCQIEAGVDCSTLLPCMESVCDPFTGECSEIAIEDGSECEDELICTTDEVCEAGTCVSKAVLCEDGNSCTTGVCLEVLGGCEFTLNNGEACEGSEGCLVEGICEQGECRRESDGCVNGCEEPIPLSCGDILRGQVLTGPSFLNEYTCTGWAFQGPEARYTYTALESSEATVVFESESDSVALIFFTGSSTVCEGENCLLHTGFNNPLALQQFETLTFVVDSVYPEPVVYSIGLHCPLPSLESECAAAETVGCAACTCESCVCDLHPECCETAWSPACSEACNGECGGCTPTLQCEYSAYPGTGKDSCSACVCALDSLCCGVSWDGGCASQAHGDCVDLCGCEGWAGSCCESQSTQGCNESSCASCVCQDNPHCCEVSWDSSCVARAKNDCVDSCACAASSTTCCLPHALAGCESPACVSCVCESLPFCCTIAWDGQCTEEAQQGFCADACPCAEML